MSESEYRKREQWSALEALWWKGCRKQPPRAAVFCQLFTGTETYVAHGHVVYAMQEVPFWAPFDAVFDTSCPGNERCAVDLAA